MTNDNFKGNEYVSVEEAAKVVDTCEFQAVSLANKGMIAWYKVGGQLFVSLSDLKEAVANK